MDDQQNRLSIVEMKVNSLESKFNAHTIETVRYHAEQKAQIEYITQNQEKMSAQINKNNEACTNLKLELERNPLKILKMVGSLNIVVFGAFATLIMFIIANQDKIKAFFGG